MFIEIINSKTKSIESLITVPSQHQGVILECLNIEALSSGWAFELTFDEIEIIKNYLPESIKYAKHDLYVIRSKVMVDDLTYETHTGRELSMMLKAIKPMAVFSALSPDPNNLAQIPEIEFDEYVAQGKFIKYEHSELNGDTSLRFVYYALPDQIWRVEAHKLLQKTARLSGWNDGLTRMEGSLLGYSDAQNDEYLKLVNTGYE